MPKAIKFQLWRLIKSLTKAEKRNFKLFAKRGGATDYSKFIRLFNLLDRLSEPDDATVQKRLDLNTVQFSNLKRHLYQQVLTSLRMIYNLKEIDIEIREFIDFTRILYGKGHYLDALRTLERAKAKAVEHSQDLLHLEILEFQKLIEARHVTLSLQEDNKLDLLLNESARRCYSVLNTSELFSLNIQIHGYYIERGHSRSAEQKEEAEFFWKSIQTQRVDLVLNESTFNQKVNRFQAVMWYRYIQLDFAEALSSAMEAYALFSLSRQMMFMDPDLYLRCLYYVTMFAYLTKDEKTLDRYLLKMDNFLSDEKIKLNENSKMIGSIYLNMANYHQYFLRCEVEKACILGASIVRYQRENKFLPNQHRWGLFLYKYAAALFLKKAFDEALDQLNAIINMRTNIFREDLLISTRLLHAICNFELGNYILVESHLTGLSRLLRRSREAANCHRMAVTTLRRLVKTPASEHQAIFQELQTSLVTLADSPFEQKALTYLDLSKWLERG